MSQTALKPLKPKTIAQLAGETASRMPTGSRGWVILDAVAAANPQSLEATIAAWTAAIFTSDAHHDGRVDSPA